MGTVAVPAGAQGARKVFICGDMKASPVSLTLTRRAAVEETIAALAR
jgi:hypothetical protein